jgi:hypothetical protein
MHKMNYICIEILFRRVYLRIKSYQVPLKRRYTFTIPHCITSHKRGVTINIAKKAFKLSPGIIMKPDFYINCFLTTFLAQQFSAETPELYFCHFLLKYAVCNSSGGMHSN